MSFFRNLLGTTKNIFRLGRRLQIEADPSANLPKLQTGQHDIDFRSPNTNDALVFDGSKWKPSPVSSGGGGSGAYDAKVSVIPNKSSDSISILESDYDSPNLLIKNIFSNNTYILKDSSPDYYLITNTYTYYTTEIKKIMTSNGIIKSIEINVLGGNYFSFSVRKNNKLVLGTAQFSNFLATDIEFLTGDEITITISVSGYGSMIFYRSYSNHGWTFTLYDSIPDYPDISVTASYFKEITNIEKKPNFDIIKIINNSSNSIIVNYYSFFYNLADKLVLKKNETCELIYDGVWKIINPKPKAKAIFYQYTNNLYSYLNSSNIKSVEKNYIAWTPFSFAGNYVFTDNVHRKISVTMDMQYYNSSTSTAFVRMLVSINPDVYHYIADNILSGSAWRYRFSTSAIVSENNDIYAEFYDSKNLFKDLNGEIEVEIL